VAKISKDKRGRSVTVGSKAFLVKGLLLEIGKCNNGSVKGSRSELGSVKVSLKGFRIGIGTP